MPKRSDIKTILVIGAGPIVIGQACEFDYSGAQACKALKEEGYRVILVNSNPATIMTDPETAAQVAQCVDGVLVLFDTEQKGLTATVGEIDATASAIQTTGVVETASVAGRVHGAGGAVVFSQQRNVLPTEADIPGSGFDVGTRSEERRVGKECRSRWSPYH